ncbi:unnamed protein product [Paramecium pentaurelia]|uniref:Uncharacterized protein n=1 Tax=Paramecium pentaurelia TaxID=43138 RepID=A0A8S1TLA1_9CILI|nr:unnamed protein product [Paramecium pentaurelia]
MSRRKSSICSQKEKKTEKIQDQETQEIPIKKKVKIEKRVVIKVPFADIISSDDDSNEFSQILCGIRSKFISDVPNLDSPILIRKSDTKEDSQLF